jgi:MarR-like DNA-binding transcriptional regulator SgrR of sgrS sRNA
LYGGTLHVAMRAASESLDPADAADADSFARRNLMFLLFDTLVSIDNSGRVQPALASSWDASPENKRWQFRLRKGIALQDGTALSADVAADSLRFANPSWSVTAHSDMVIVERENSDPELLAELAQPRNAIAKRIPGAPPVGSGPFQIVDWQPRKHLTLAANENYWRGRPFLDRVEIEVNRAYRDQLIELELGKADLVEVPPEQTHRVSQQGRSVANSSPMELIALVFARDPNSPEEKLLRNVLALTIERGSIRNVLLQGAGQSTASILPTWMSGYGFVFPIDADLPRARRERSQVTSIPAWTLGYDSADPMAQLLAERIALNAKDPGLSLQPTANLTADIKLMRIPLASLDPGLALTAIATSVGSPALRNQGGSAEELYAAEQSLLATQRILPLFHLPVSYSAAPTLKGWSVRSDGTWRLDNVWLGSAKP